VEILVFHVEQSRTNPIKAAAEKQCSTWNS